MKKLFLSFLLCVFCLSSGYCQQPIVGSGGLPILVLTYPTNGITGLEASNAINAAIVTLTNNPMYMPLLTAPEANFTTAITLDGETLFSWYDVLGYRAYANAWIESPATLSISFADTYEVVAPYSSAPRMTLFSGNATSGSFTNTRAGVYIVSHAMSFSGSGGASDSFECSVFTNATQVTSCSWLLKTTTTNNVNASSGEHVIYLPANTAVDLRIKNTGGTGNIIIRKLLFLIKSI